MSSSDWYDEVCKQHVELYAAIESVETAMAAGECVQQKWVEFARLAAAHMAFEERALDSLGYPSLDAHQAIHRWVLKDIVAAAGNPVRMAAEKKRFIEHTATHDAEWVKWWHGNDRTA